MSQAIDFSEIFGRLKKNGCSEETLHAGGVNIRLVRVKSDGKGRWDHHDQTSETVVVWSGEFTVEFRDHTLRLSSGQCCVVPAGAEHQGTSLTGAEVILFQQAH